MIGDVNEDYVLAADSNVVRPRSRWKTWAACAACAALVLCAYPVWQAARPHDLPFNETIPLHTYTVVEAGGALTTQGDETAELDNGKQPVPEPTQPSRGDGPSDTSGRAHADSGAGEQGIDGAHYNVPGQDAPSQETAIAQYQGLLRGLGGQGSDLPREPETYPDWFAGSWIDNSYYPEAKLAVAIVDGFRTAELETQIEGWCGGEIVFTDAKYPLEHLSGLMGPAAESVKGTGLSCGIGMDVEENCLTVDLYSLSGGSIPDSVLATLAELDPDGDAIRVRLFTSVPGDELSVKGPAPDRPAAGPVFDGARVEPGIDAGPEPTPTPVDGSEPEPAAISVAPSITEQSRPARTEDGHDIPGSMFEK